MIKDPSSSERGATDSKDIPKHSAETRATGNKSIAGARNDTSEEDTTLQLQLSDSLGDWNDVFISSAGSAENENGVAVGVVENGTAPDSIIVTVPRDLGNGRQLFVRLSAQIP